ncbi:leucyl-tRNA synthetase [Nadsonia fulvescens var. elongata DSM 6958]|uniref:leucine--tRNA ligase n=1 Tax=Nadsonia fulvescens var. elongata DSM 6958 TaxID=857566 RepID=A0A1E3PP14_9ASCO|nr:leucyl-tRNA synthetase [Nadsonia fulvescens var. elongata DSM 6958]
MAAPNDSKPAPEAKTLVMENTTRRDTLIAIEKKYQKVWADEKVFEVDAPTLEEIPNSDDLDSQPKHFSTMAYPYMNGVLHAGHSFTLSKVEFSTGFERMQGKRALFPLGFHCTGMPIKACADKLVRELEQFGPNFDQNVPAEEETSVPVVAAKKEDVTKFNAKKSKAAAKQGRGKYQFEIMLQLGISREEIKEFSDPLHWLEHFPPLCQKDCTEFGARIDWRRSFITTDVNPYYDAFVRWQMNRLHELGNIKFGERYTIYSAKDGQPCMDHDRSSGEAVLPQEYTGIKINISEWPEAAKEVLANADIPLDGKKCYLVAATLRPETMYGQTCCFVSPKIDYGLFDAGNNEYFITTERAFKNMSYQKLTPVRGEYKPLAIIPGKTLIGARINAPLSAYPEVRVLPMETVLANKGTGVVTCVPSDSPDDYITTVDLRNKPEYYGIDPEWVKYDPIPIIETPSYGNLTAEKLVQDLKIKSPKDKDALAKAKELAYKEGFYQGVMVYGKYVGEKVEVAKAKCKADLIASGDAFTYNEPENVVISRSGDECIVSLEDQYYMNYGEETWKNKAEECLANMNTFSSETRNGFESVLDWLKNWALSRTYGLGTKIPWDHKYLVESLSDSTVYMAYYTICHFLHSDVEGKKLGSFNITPEQMTDEVFDYIFCRRDEINCEIPIEKLNAMRREFEYFYPLDCRISGKDLIPNHLTFFIYVHTALFPKKFWPRGIRANGHLLLNNEKMAKSTGNFMTLEQIVKKFGADAARIALADGGDTIEDANFDESNANAAILRLYNFKEWAEEIVANSDKLRTGATDGFFDTAFENEMNQLIAETKKEYVATNYKSALKSGLFDFMIARDYYRDSTAGNIGMHKDLIIRYIETQALLIAPIAPHFSEYIYREILKKEGSIQTAKFPEVSKPVDKAISASLQYVRDLARSVREAEGANLKKKKSNFDAKKPSKLTFYIVPHFPSWQEQYIDLVRESFDSLNLTFTDDLKAKVGKLGDVKRGMQFVNHVKSRLTSGGESAENVFARKLLFDEVEIVKSVLELLKKAPQCIVEEVQAVLVKDGEVTGTDIITGEQVEITASPKALSDAIPGVPAIVLVNV